MQLGFWVAVVAVVAWSVLKLDWRHLVSSSPTATYAYGIARGKLLAAGVFAGQRHPFEASQVAPGIWLGSITDAHCPDELRIRNIRGVVTVVIGVQPSYPLLFDYHSVAVRDVAQEQLAPHFGAAHSFMDNILKGRSTGGALTGPHTGPPPSVLVHCMHGASRSASVVISYLMRDRRLFLQEALEQVRRARPRVNPNSGFMQQLQAFETQLVAAGHYEVPDPAGSNN
jgi:hypothetical protein